MDANYLLIWFVGLSSLIWLITWLRLRPQGSRGWLVVAAIVASVLVTGLVVAPDMAGYLAAAVWFPLFLLPLLLLRMQHALLARQRYRTATTLAWLMAILHPADGFRQQPRLYGALALLAAGRLEEAQRVLGKLGDIQTPIGRLAHAQLLRAENRWEELVSWVERYQPPGALLREPNIAAWTVRGLCEVGRYADALRVAQQLPRQLRGAGGAHVRPLLHLFLVAFGGRLRATELLLAGPLRSYSRSLGDVWRATALQAAGRPEEAWPVLETLRHHGDALIRSTAERRVEQPVAVVDATALPEPAQRWLDNLERALEEAAAVGTLSRPPSGRPVATYFLLLAELVTFLVELPGGTTDLQNLIDLGALVGPAYALDGQYWRLLTANFLHYGALHLLLNLVGLWVLGRFLERVIGPGRLVVCYVLAGVGALGAILAWTTLRGSDPYLLVGASASVMGLLGCAGAVLLQRVRGSRSRLARRDLLGLTAILVLQTAFDLSTPQVSFAAHAGGALLGFAFGWAVVRRLPRLARAPRPA